MKTTLASLTTAGLLVAAGNASAVEVFFEDFESPAEVDSAASQNNTNGTLPDNGQWVGATQGFGSGRRRIADESSAHFTEAGAGEQAFAFRYTNSGLTTAAGTIGAPAIGETVTVSFDVVRDPGANDGLPYDADLFAWNPDVAGVPVRRDDVRSDSFGTLLAGVSGDASDDGLYTTISFDFYADPIDFAGVEGRDLTLRFKGATSSAIIDNVEVSATPEPGTLALLALGGIMAARRRRG